LGQLLTLPCPGLTRWRIVGPRFQKKPHSNIFSSSFMQSIYIYYFSMMFTQSCWDQAYDHIYRGEVWGSGQAEAWTVVEWFFGLSWAQVRCCLISCTPDTHYHIQTLDSCQTCKWWPSDTCRWHIFLQEIEVWLCPPPQLSVHTCLAIDVGMRDLPMSNFPGWLAISCLPSGVWSSPSI
jgi:hypothetical protein